MARTLRSTVAALALVLAIAGCGSSGRGAGTAEPVPGHGRALRPPSSYVAERTVAHGAQALTVTSTATGRVIETLLPDPWHGMQIGSAAVDDHGRVWVTLSSGPLCTSNVAGCGPKRDTCANEVLRIDPATGERQVELRTGDDVLIDDAVPAPDGRLLAYLEGGCSTSYFNQYVSVRDLANGATWSIGRDLEACHSLSGLTWSGSSTLAAAYGPSRVHHPTPGYGEGYCLQSGPSQLAVFPATHHASGLPAAVGRADRHCEIKGDTAIPSGYVGLEACGGQYFLSGRVRLLRFDSDLAITARIPLGSCLDSGDLSATPGGAVVGTAYESCVPPDGTPPAQVTFTELQGKLRILGRATGPLRSINSVAW